MKQAIIALLMLALPAAVMAQTETVTPAATPAVSTSQPQAFRFGYFSFEEVFRSAGDYTIAQRNLKDLKAKYDAEQKRAEDEFNKKYEEFLDEESSFAPNIREKRQAELEDIMKKNVAFKQESARLIKQAEADALAPLRERITSAAQRIGTERGFAFILNTDNNAVPFVNGAYGENITEQLKKIFE